MRLLGRLGKWFGILALALILGAGGLLAYLTVTEYTPEAVEPVTVAPAARSGAVRAGDMLKVVTFNTGYAGLDRTQDFFMDGGAGVQPGSLEQVKSNMAGILSALDAQNAQVYLLQEVDVGSRRSYGTEQRDYYRHGLSLNAAFAYNYRCDFVPLPWPPMGKVASGLMTLTELSVTEATRESLPAAFPWPARVINLKRCLLIERVPVAETERELVIINLHLEAYDSGEGKAAQIRQLAQIMKAEYRKGNYVVAGGDFNQMFEGTGVINPKENVWTPGFLQSDELPSGLRYVSDASAPTCRLLDQPYEGDRQKSTFYVIDGFLLSDNVKLNHVETIDLNFQHADHNPVMIQITLI